MQALLLTSAIWGVLHHHDHDDGNLFAALLIWNVTSNTTRLHFLVTRG